MPPINQTFTLLMDPSVQSRALFTHQVSWGSFDDEPERMWIRKEALTPATAKSEMLAQEFFRLIIPHQPETRIGVNPATNVHYIYSEGVKDYKPLPYECEEDFTNGTYTGLGQAMLVAMFVHEVDLKNGNIGLDSEGRVIKIDGDWSFAEIVSTRPGKAYPFTHDSIANLPYPPGPSAFNWLDLQIRGVSHTSGSIVAPNLTDSLQFRKEVNQAILKISLLPDAFIERFVDAHISMGSERFISFLTSRRDALLQAALQNPSFRHYIKTEINESDVDRFIAHLESFTVNGYEGLLRAAEAPLADGVKDRKNFIYDLALTIHPCDVITKPIALSTTGDDDPGITMDLDDVSSLHSQSNPVPPMFSSDLSTQSQKEREQTIAGFSKFKSTYINGKIVPAADEPSQKPMPGFHDE